MCDCYDEMIERLLEKCPNPDQVRMAERLCKGNEEMETSPKVVGHSVEYGSDIVEIYVSRDAIRRMGESEGWWHKVMFSIRKTEQKPVQIRVLADAIEGNEFDPSLCEIDSVVESAIG